MEDCQLAHRQRSKIILAAYLVTVIFSGFAYPLGHFDWAIWPWRNTWFMFSYSAQHLVKMEAYGKLEDGRQVQINLDKWFRYPVAFETARYNEMPRLEKSMKRQAQYVCEQYNHEAPVGQRAVYLTYWDVRWVSWVPQTKTRRTLQEAKDKKEIEYRQLGSYKCPIGTQIL